MCDNGHTGTLVVRAAGGDEVALQILLADSRAQVCRYIAQRIPNDLCGHIDAEDIVQESHIEVFRRVHGFDDRGPRSFDRWVTAIAISRLRNTVRFFRAVKRGGDTNAAHAVAGYEDSTIALLDLHAGPGRTPSRCIARVEAVDAVETAMAQLPQRYQQALRLVHLQGLPVSDVARQLGRTERAVHGLCRRGLEMLRNHLESATNYLSSRG